MPRYGSLVAPRNEAKSSPDSFLGDTVDQAHRVLDAEEGWPTYRAGIDFLGLAMAALSTDADDGRYLAEEPVALYLIWGSLTDEMDAPGRGSPEQDAAAVRHMKQAAAEWLTVVDVPAKRASYLEHWVYAECGYRPSGSGITHHPWPFRWKNAVVTLAQRLRGLNERVFRPPASKAFASESDLARLAREACDSRGIVWREPHSIRKGWRWWRVLTPADRRGGNVIVMIARRGGRVKVRFNSR